MALDSYLRQKLEEGAAIVCREAQRIALSFSKRTAAATHVVSDSVGVGVETNSVEAPMARPFQGGLRHPLFGNTDHWYPQPYHPYMSLAWEIKRPDVEQKAAEWAEEEWKRKLQ